MRRSTVRAGARTVALGIGALALAWSAAARADNFWQPATAAENERRAEYARWMKVGDDNAILAGRLTHDRDSFPIDYRTLSKRKRFAVNRAIEGYEKAFDALPNAPEPYYRAAEMLYHYYVERPTNTPVIANRYREHARKAVAYWQQFERLAPLDPRVRGTLFNRALVHTKMADEDNYKQAVALYEAIIRRSDIGSEHPENIATWYGNMAETYMMIGDLSRAIDTYRVALEALDRISTGYGLAVALDRDEQGELARDIVRRYGDDGLRSMLHDTSVFYVPSGERAYYIALGYDALGYWDKAAEYYRAFILSGAHPQYQPQAKENLAWVISRKKELRKRKIQPPRLPRSLGI